jgi:hypothetical protein
MTLIAGLYRDPTGFADANTEVRAFNTGDDPGFRDGNRLLLHHLV